MPPIVAQIEPEPGLIPAVVTVLPGLILALRPSENATEEERRIIGRIALAQFLCASSPRWSIGSIESRP
jgi:hypothetical protein